ncbi:hypothetical protein PGB90_006207 [Kerria lacca]
MDFKLGNCETEYKKDPKIKKHDIQELLKWVKEQPDMPKVKEYVLIKCYQVCDYNFEKAKRLTKFLCHFKNKGPKLFVFSGRNYGPPKFDTFFDLIYCFVVPRTTPEGYRILYIGLKNFDSLKYEFKIRVAITIKTLHMVIMEQGVCPGYIMISDSHGTACGHSRAASLSIIRKILYFYHLHVYSDVNDLYKDVSKDYIPKDLGGNLAYTRNELNELTRAIMDIFSDAEVEKLQTKILKAENKSE